MIPTAITELAVPPTPILKQFKLNKSDITGIVIYGFTKLIENNIAYINVTT